MNEIMEKMAELRCCGCPNGDRVMTKSRRSYWRGSRLNSSLAPNQRWREHEYESKSTYLDESLLREM